MKVYFVKQLYDGKGLKSDVFVVVKGEQIEEVTETNPGTEFETVEVMTPGFIDVHSHIGLARWGEPSNGGDVNDYIDFTNPMINAFDAFDHEDPALEDSAEFGVLVTCILPGSGNLVGGEGAIVYVPGKLKSDRYIQSGGLKGALGENPKYAGNNKGQRPTTRLGVFGVLRKSLEEARQTEKQLKSGKKSEEEIEPIKLKWLRVLRGELRLRIHVHTEADLLSLFRFADEYGFKYTIEHGGNLHHAEVFEEMLKRNVPFNYGPIDTFAYKYELRFDTWKNLETMRKTGLEFALMTDHPVVLQRNLLLQLRYFLLVGYSKQEAIATITSHAAKNLGIDDRMGTVEKGKEANLLIWDDDPFILPSKPSKVIFKGEEVTN